MAREWFRARAETVKKFFSNDVDEGRKVFLESAIIGTGAVLLTSCSEQTIQRLTDTATATCTVKKTTETRNFNKTITPSPVPSEDLLITPNEPANKTVSPTETKELTPEPFSTPTINPQEIAKLMDLNPDRTYVVTTDNDEGGDEKYLVDTYNQAKMAKWGKEDGAWIDSSLEEKYGLIAPQKIDPPYNPRQRTFGSNIDAYDTRYISYILNPIFTGNVFKDIWFNPDLASEVTRYALETVIRDDKANLHKLNFYLGSPDINGLKPVNITDSFGGSVEKTGTIDEVIKFFKPAEQINTYFYYQWPENVLPSRGCYSRNGTCRDEIRAEYYMLQENLDTITELVSNLNNMESYKYATDQNEIILPSRFIIIKE